MLVLIVNLEFRGILDLISRYMPSKYNYAIQLKAKITVSLKCNTKYASQKIVKLE